MSLPNLVRRLPVDGHTVGLIVPPRTLFHQIQLTTCAALARRDAKRTAKLSTLPAKSGMEARSNLVVR
jgi:hypothetical protein